MEKKKPKLRDKMYELALKQFKKENRKELKNIKKLIKSNAFKGITRTTVHLKDGLDSPNRAYEIYFRERGFSVYLKPNEKRKKIDLVIDWYLG
jgi:(p)ppGpp synthase/HD superfamily hydrolase